MSAPDSRYVLLLRGINVGGRNRLPMNNLKDSLRRIGCDQVDHYIQSGNLVFAARDGDSIVREIEQAIRSDFGLDIPAIVWPAHRFEEAVERNPFTGDAAEETAFVFLSGAGSQEWADRASDLGEYRRIGDIAYVHCPDGISGNAAARHLLSTPKPPAKATMRNWRTVNRIRTMLADMANVDGHETAVSEQG